MRRLFIAFYLLAAAAFALGAAWLWGFRCEGFGCTGLGVAWAAWASGQAVTLTAGAALTAWRLPGARSTTALHAGLALQLALSVGLALYWLATQVLWSQ